MYVNIKFLIYIFILLTFVQCTKSSEWIVLPPEERVYVDCMISSENGVSARISSIGALGQSEPGYLDDTNNISLHLYDKANATSHSFVFDKEEMKFYIPLESLSPLGGNSYDIRIVRKNYGPEIRYAATVPAKVAIHSFSVNDFSFETVGPDRYLNRLNCHFKIQPPPQSKNYYLVEFSGHDKWKPQVNKLGNNEGAIRIQAQGSALLIDGSRLMSDVIRLSIMGESDSVPEMLHLKFSHITEQTYRYLLFVENAETYPQGNFVNPAIAPLNINTHSILGSINAGSTLSYSFRIR